MVSRGVPLTGAKLVPSPRGKENHMNFEKYTDRSRGFIQSVQSLAQREGH
jgi:hypothetical protein